MNWKDIVFPAYMFGVVLALPQLMDFAKTGFFAQTFVVGFLMLSISAAHAYGEEEKDEKPEFWSELDERMYE